MRESLKPYAKDMAIKIHNELEHSKTNQRAVFLITGSYLELLVNTLVKKKCKNYQKIKMENEFSFFFKLLMLNEIGLITDDFYKRLETFRKIRNELSHNPIFNLTEQKIKDLSNNQFTKIDDLYAVCNILIIELWNQYTDIFVPEFLPAMLKNKT